ncbi:O-antigen ligase family protein [Jeongeupia wiesaeckerbachi]|uniref:O-antigen ligase family protein n=1 Tax=Jeongeupia wiesaeckerbachi TaxID=3051218 RepID=UPI003D803352
MQALKKDPLGYGLLALMTILLPLMANTALAGLRNTSLGLLLLLSLAALYRNRPKVDPWLAGAWVVYFVLNTVSIIVIDGWADSRTEYVRSVLTPSVLLLSILAISSYFDGKTQLKLGVIASALTTVLYVGELYRYYGEWEVRLYVRDYGFRFLVFLPMLLLALKAPLGRWWKALAGSLLLFQLLAMVIMGFRGAWLTMSAILLLFALRNLSRKQLLTLIVVAACAAVGAIYATKTLAPKTYEFLQFKMSQRDSSGRIDKLWMPTVTMIADKPLLGHGYGNANFSKTFAAEAVKHDSWAWKEATHPHNIWLEVAFATGLAGAALLLTIMLRSAWLLWRRSAEGNYLAEAALLGLIGFYGVLGMTEPLAWAPLGLFAGIALAQSARFGDKT